MSEGAPTREEVPRCEACDKPVDATSPDVILALEQVWVPGEGSPEIRWSVDGRKCYFHGDHLPAGAKYLYRLVSNDAGKVSRQT